jgi:hypothetical protein
VRVLIVAEEGRVVQKQWRGWGKGEECTDRSAEVFGSDVVEHLDLTDHLFVPSKLTSLRFVMPSVLKQQQIDWSLSSLWNLRGNRYEIVTQVMERKEREE